jgi:DNA-directed RNA polymerase subunit RPC12/RpoP
MLYGMLEIGIKCPKCDSPVPLNGPWQVAHCDSCQTDIDIPSDYWPDIFGDMLEDIKSDLAEGEGRNSTIFGTFHTTMLYGELHARCEGCKTKFEPKADLTEGYTHTCEECGRKIEVIPSPQWLKGATTLFVDASLQSKSAVEETDISSPIAFTCPQCGGALMVDGKERLLPCQFCGVSVYLPDDLWLRLHPAKIKQRWFVGFKG